MKRLVLISAVLLLMAGWLFADTETVTPTVTATVTETAADTLTDTATFTPTVTGTVSCTYTPTFTGTPADTKTVTETITPSQTASITSTRTATRTMTNTATFTATCTFTPTFSVTETPTQTGTATATATITFTLTPYITPTIAADLYEKLKGTLYPNPAKAGDNIYMIYDFNWNYGVKIVIYTLDGRAVKETESSPLSGKGRLVIGTTGLAPGVYFYKTTITYEDTLMAIGSNPLKTEISKKLVIFK